MVVDVAGIPFSANKYDNATSYTVSSEPGPNSRWTSIAHSMIAVPISFSVIFFTLRPCDSARDSFPFQHIILRHAYCGHGTRRPIICVKKNTINGLTTTNESSTIDAYDGAQMET